MPNQTLELDQIVMEAAPIQETQVPAQILIVPWGEVKSTAGSFVIDDEAAQATLAAFQEHGTDLPIDYEHQTLGGPYSSPNGLAPAAGWIKALRVVTPAEADDGNAPGIWADVEWTADAAEKLSGKQYRYLSPVALVRREDRRVVGLHSVALTNKPAIVGMPPVVNRNAPQSFDAPAAIEDLRGLLSLDESATHDLIIVAAAQQIRAMQRTDDLREAAQRVERAMSAGKLSESQREWALTLAQRDPAEFDRWESAAPQLVPLGRCVRPSASQADRNALRRSAEQAARAEYRANRELLEPLCTEEAYIAAELRSN
jgi:phage I-like protein